MITEQAVSNVVSQLRSIDAEVRQAGLSELHSWRGERFDQGAIRLILEEATGSFPPSSPWDRGSDALISALWSDAAGVAPGLVADCIPRLPPESRWPAMRLLAEAGTEDAAQVLGDALRTVAADHTAPFPDLPVFLSIERDPRFREHLVRPFVELLGNPGLRSLAASPLLAYAMDAPLGVGYERKIVDALAQPTIDLMDSLRTELAESGPAVRWDDDRDHGARRSEAGLFLDLLGRLQDPAVQDVLAVGAAHPDPWLALWAALGLVRRGDEPFDAIARAAADPECRVALFDHLDLWERLDLMPAAERTQSKLAEGEMVRWLTYPTELGRPPDEIEEVAVYTSDEDGLVDLYAFRFRCLDPHWSAKDGWMVGVAGPYRRDEQPTSTSYGSTFSMFQPYEEGALAERVEAIIGTLDDWSAQRPPDGTVST